MAKYDQKLVVFGGGTGLSNLLRGLIDLNTPEKITAVPSAWDDGGSSGRLRDEMGALPPGDLRQCLLACMEDDAQKAVAQKLFDDRLADIEGPFKGHSLGNLVMARLEKLYFGQDRGIEAAKNLFRIRANLLPATIAELRLIAKTQSGIEIQGETNIDERRHREDFKREDKISRIYFNTQAKANPEVIKAIKEADKIIFSAGDLYTSVLPHLLIEGVAEGIKKSQAQLFFIVNLMTKQGETDFYKASDHLGSFVYYLGDKNRVNFVIANKDGISPEIVELYKSDHQDPVELNLEECKKIAPEAKILPLHLAAYHPSTHILRHDSHLLASTILETT